MRHSFIIASMLSAVMPLGAGAAGIPDAAGVDTVARIMQYHDYNYIHNVESGSLNPVSIAALPLSQLASVGVSYSWQDGDYHRVDRSGNIHGLKVDTYGFRKGERVSFEGGISYTNRNEKARCWNSTLYIDPLNPFILADAYPSDYNSELFDVSGRVALNLSSRLRIGLNAVYNAGVASDEQDPRVETKGMRFVINPGVGYDLSPSLSLGATGGLNLMSESLSYTTLVAAQTYDFYLMSGLGSFYPIVNKSYTRDYKGTSWFAGGSLRFAPSASVADYLTATFSHHFEKAVDGGSVYQFRGGDYNNDFVTVTNRLSVNAGRMAHNVTIDFRADDIHGIWYDQVSETVNGSTVWNVVSESVKYKERRYNYSLGYRADWLDRSGSPSLTAAFSVGSLHSDATDYPDLYRREYTRLKVGADVKKHFNVRRVRFGIGVSFTGDYDMTSRDSYNFAGQELEQDYSLPMNAWLTSSSYNFSGSLDMMLPVAGYVVGAYVKGGATRCTKGAMGLKGESMNSIACGVTLSF